MPSRRGPSEPIGEKLKARPLGANPHETNEDERQENWLSSASVGPRRASPRPTPRFTSDGRQRRIGPLRLRKLPADHTPQLATLSSRTAGRGAGSKTSSSTAIEFSRGSRAECEAHLPSPRQSSSAQPRCVPSTESRRRKPCKRLRHRTGPYRSLSLRLFRVPVGRTDRRSGFCPTAATAYAPRARLRPWPPVISRVRNGVTGYPGQSARRPATEILRCVHALTVSFFGMAWGLHEGREANATGRRS